MLNLKYKSSNNNIEINIETLKSKKVFINKNSIKWILILVKIGHRV